MADNNIVGAELVMSLDGAKILVMRGLAGKAPRVNATNNHWEVYDNATQAWLDTGVAATGAPGTDGTDGTDGYSPVVTITNITGGHRVNITDKTHPSGQNFDVMDGEDGIGADSVVYLGYDSQLGDDDPSITIHSSNPSYTTAATIAPALMNTILRNVRFMDDYTFDVYDLVGYDTTSPATLTFASVKNNAIKFCTMTGTSGKPSYSSVPISSDFVLLRMDANGYVYNGTTAITGAQINTLAASRKAVFLWDEDSECLYTYNVPYNDAAIFTAPSYNKGGVTNKVTVNASDNESTFNAIVALPTVTASDNGKFLRVVSGAWAAAAVPSAESVSFGGDS